MTLDLVPYVVQGKTLAEDRVIRGLYQSPCKRINAIQFQVDGYEPFGVASKLWVENLERTVF